MPKSQTYMTRALQSRDPRFAQILGRLGYSTTAEPKAKEEADDLLDLYKDELIALANAEGVHVAAGDTKAEIADKIIANRSSGG